MKQTRSAGGIVINNKGLILVVNQRGTSWSLPKGHIEKGEDALTAAKREIFEESGITDLKLVKELGNYQRHRIGELKTIFMFLFKTGQESLKPEDPENPEAIWVEKSKVAGFLTHKKDKEFFLRVIDKI